VRVKGFRFSRFAARDSKQYRQCSMVAIAGVEGKEVDYAFALAFPYKMGFLEFWTIVVLARGEHRVCVYFFPMGGDAGR